MDWKEEFYQKFTDGCDKENDYYDAQFTVCKPCEVEYFIQELLNNNKSMSEEKREVIFADGFIFKKPKEGAPEFVKGDIAIKVGEFIEFLNKHNNNGWVNLNLKKSTAGKLYVDLNTWKPATDTTAPVNAAEDTREAPAATDSDIEMPPF